MNGLRKTLGLLLAIALTAFTLPATAGNDKKQFSLDMNIFPAGQTSAPFTLTATITNEGNSTINSFQVFSPPGLTITRVDTPNGTVPNPFPPGSSAAVTNMHPLKSGDFVKITLYVNTCGGGGGKWSATAWTGAKLNGQSFSIDLAPQHLLETNIACGTPQAGGAAFIVPDTLVDDCVIIGNRGRFNKDGSSTSDVSYFVTNTIPSDRQVHFRWPIDVPGATAAAFKYTITCPGMPRNDVATSLAWFNTDGTPTTGATGTPDFIQTFFPGGYEGDPLGCEVPPPGSDEAILPAPYKTLASQVLPADTYITVNTANPDGAIAHGDPPFDIVIGTGLQTERMTVTGITCIDTGNDDDGPQLGECDEHEEGETPGPPNIWFVTRAVGGTTANSHDANALVMYTPLPIMQITQGVFMGGEYKALNQAQMCVVKQTPYDPESHTHSTTYIDIGDGGMRQP